MNYKMVFFTMGRVVLLEAALLVLPMAVSLLYGEKCALSFALTILVALAVGFLLTKLCRGEHGSSSIKDGFMIVALTWIMLSAIGALPFVFSREIPLYVDAFFETVSGFTTTGATILPDGDALLAELHPLDRRHGDPGVCGHAAEDPGPIHQHPQGGNARPHHG